MTIAQYIVIGVFAIGCSVVAKLVADCLFAWRENRNARRELLQFQMLPMAAPFPMSELVPAETVEGVYYIRCKEGAFSVVEVGAAKRVKLVNNLIIYFDESGSEHHALRKYWILLDENFKEIELTRN